MSLFLRLWIMGTLTAFASAAAAVVAFAVITAQGRVLEEERQVVALARMVAYAASMDPLADSNGHATQELLRSRAMELMATGPLLSLAVLDADQRPLADLSSPGLEDESILRVAPELFTALEDISAGAVTPVVRHNAVIYVALPLIDQRQRVRGYLGVAMPVQEVRRDDDGIVTFAVVAAAIALALGLLAAVVLTRQVAWPVRNLAELAGRLDDAEFDTSRVSGLIGRRDEIGQLARVMLRLVQALDHLGRVLDDRPKEGPASGIDERPRT